MADAFRPVFDAIKETTAALVEAGEANQLANAALQRAGAGITKMADAAMDAREDREDLRVTVVRLQELVMQLTTEVRALRNRPSQ